jgi:GLPGLI family protein
MLLNRFIFLVLLMGIVFSVSGQPSQGVITYEVRMDVHRSLPADRQELKAMIPQFRIENYQLFFTPAASLYKAKEEETPPTVGGGGGMRMMMRMPKSETFIDRESRERTVFQDMLGRNFLIVDTMGIEPWKFGNEQMEIAGYMCLMAWFTDTVAKQEVTAWFAPQLPPFMGPDKYVTLPGTVLAVDINNGERVWVARQIEAREVKPAEVRKPSRGDKMTREEFNKFVEEQMQRMNPGGGNIRMF